MNSSVESGSGCVQNKETAPKKRKKKVKTHKDYCLNLEVFRAKKSKSSLFKMYDNLPVHANAIRVIRFLHGCYFKAGNTKICPSVDSIRKAINLKTSRGVQKIIAKLVSEGFLIVEDVFDPSKPKQPQVTNEYHFAKLMELHYKIYFIKNQISVLDGHISGFHTTKMMKDGAKKSKDKKEKQLKGFLSDYEKMKKEIASLPKRKLAISGQIFGLRVAESKRKKKDSGLQRFKL